MTISPDARRAEIAAELDAISLAAEERRKQSHSPWLYPTTSDWMTTAELERAHELQLEMVSLRTGAQAAAKARVAAKRAARAAAAAAETRLS